MWHFQVGDIFLLKIDVAAVVAAIMINIAEIISWDNYYDLK